MDSLPPWSAADFVFPPASLSLSLPSSYQPKVHHAEPKGRPGRAEGDRMAPRIGGQGALVAQPRGVREADALREQRLGARHCARPEPHLPRTRVLRPTPRPRPTIVVQRAQGLQCVRQERWVRPGHGFRHRYVRSQERERERLALQRQGVVGFCRTEPDAPSTLPSQIASPHHLLLLLSSSQAFSCFTCARRTPSGPLWRY